MGDGRNGVPVEKLVGLRFRLRLGDVDVLLDGEKGWGGMTEKEDD